jgi:hypothetical protein
LTIDLQLKKVAISLEQHHKRCRSKKEKLHGLKVAEQPLGKEVAGIQPIVAAVQIHDKGSYQLL